MRVILARYLVRSCGLSREIDLSNIFELLPNLDPSYPQAGRDIHAYRYGERADVPLYVFSHLRYEDAMRNLDSTPVVVLVRSPFDVLVSYYFHVTRQRSRTSEQAPAGQRRALAAFALDPSRGAPALGAYWNGWASRLYDHDILVESYEHLTERPLLTMRRICRHFGLEAHEDWLEAAIRSSTFESMQAMEARSGIANIAFDRADPEARRVRRGVVGGYRDYLGPSDVDAVRRALRLSPLAEQMLVRSGVADLR